jgi:hypothetical protein
MDVAALCHARLNCKSADEVESRRAAGLHPMIAFKARLETVTQARRGRSNAAFCYIHVNEVRYRYPVS